MIFLDMDGVMDTTYYKSYEQIEEKFKILGSICHELNAKIVIEASCKDGIDEYTLEHEGKWLDFIFEMFDKYGIECVGRTPAVGRHTNDFSGLSMWKEDEILLYLSLHPEVEHFCVIDDDDYYEQTRHTISDLEKLRDYLVKTIYTSFDNPKEEGLLLRHKEEIARILKKENIFKNYLIENKDNLTEDFKKSFFSILERECYEELPDYEKFDEVREIYLLMDEKINKYYTMIEDGLIDEVFEQEFVKKKGRK